MLVLVEEHPKVRVILLRINYTVQYITYSIYRIRAIYISIILHHDIHNLDSMSSLHPLEPCEYKNCCVIMCIIQICPSSLAGRPGTRERIKP